MLVVEITGWRVGFLKISCTKTVRASTELGLADSKRVTDAILEGKVQRVTVNSLDAAVQLAQDLNEIGAVAHVVAEEPS